MVSRLENNLGINMLIRFLVFWLIFGGLYTTQGRVLNLYEDSEFEEQLKILNKPPLQSFQKEDGSIIDCIDIYKQPAFDHPLLKNHKIKTKPSLLLQEMMAMSSVELKDEKILSTKSKSKFPGCPSGTVPIRRTQKDDLIRANLALKHYHLMPNDHLPFVDPKQGIHYAGISTPNGTAGQYLGARLGLSVHNLTSLIPTQTSTASARVGSGIDGAFISIEFGWTINQELYGDLKPRTFGLWTADGFHKTGCFNVLCPGFVQVSKYHLPGDEITDFTVFGKELKYMFFAITKDPKTLDWWLVQSTPEVTNLYVGYWPKELFPNMFPFASNVQIGGKVSNPSLEPFKTPMGSGFFVPGDYLRTANADFRLINTSFGFMQEPQMDLMVDLPDVYQAQYIDGNNVIFGGPNIQNSTSSNR